MSESNTLREVTLLEHGKPGILYNESVLELYQEAAVVHSRAGRCISAPWEEQGQLMLHVQGCTTRCFY